MDHVPRARLSEAETATVAEAGFDVIHSQGWYLDQQTPCQQTFYFWCVYLDVSAPCRARCSPLFVCSVVQGGYVAGARIE
jgi:hypothetical protein